VRFKVVFEARRKQGDRHIGMLLVLEIARHFSRPQPVELLNDLLGICLIGVGHRSLGNGLLDRFGGIGVWTHGASSGGAASLHASSRTGLDGALPCVTAWCGSLFPP
jgi:hypothetical protein